MPGADAPDPRIASALERLARLEAATLVLVERELLREDPSADRYGMRPKRSAADNGVLQSFLAGLIAMSRPRKGGAA